MALATRALALAVQALVLWQQPTDSVFPLLADSVIQAAFDSSASNYDTMVFTPARPGYRRNASGELLMAAAFAASADSLYAAYLYAFRPAKARTWRLRFEWVPLGKGVLDSLLQSPTRHSEPADASVFAETRCMDSTQSKFLESVLNMDEALLRDRSYWSRLDGSEGTPRSRAERGKRSDQKRSTVRGD